MVTRVLFLATIGRKITLIGENRSICRHKTWMASCYVADFSSAQISQLYKNLARMCQHFNDPLYQVMDLDPFSEISNSYLRSGLSEDQHSALSKVNGLCG